MSLSRSSPVKVLCCFNGASPDWKWVAPRFSPDEVEWSFLRSQGTQMSLLRSSWAAHRLACRGAVDLIVVHGPHLATRIGLLARLQKHDCPIICYSFHHDHVPAKAKARAIGACLRPVDRFVVYSAKEVVSYHQAFGIPKEHIEMLHWGTAAPSLPSTSPLVQDRYVCSVGRSSRDYATLFAAAKILPNIPFVVVTDPACVHGLEIPPNVNLRFNLPLQEVDNLVHYGELVVLPLELKESASGHGIVVRTMYLNRPLVATECESLTDYLSPTIAKTYPPKDDKELARQIQSLWESPEERERLSASALEFVQTHCTEDNVARHFRKYLKDKFL